MQGDRDRGSRALRARLLAGAALLACLPFADEALAQAQPVPDQSAVPDVLPQGAVYVDADSAGRVGDTIVAQSDGARRVYLRADGHVLRGENLTYDLSTGAATACRAGSTNR